MQLHKWHVGAPQDLTPSQQQVIKLPAAEAGHAHCTRVLVPFCAVGIAWPGTLRRCMATAGAWRDCRGLRAPLPTAAGLSISFPSTRFTICELVFNLIKIISLLTNKKRKQCSLWGLGKMASLICRMRME